MKAIAVKRQEIDPESIRLETRGLTNVHASIEKRRTYGGPLEWTATVNWAGIGSVSPDDALAAAQEIAYVAQLAANELEAAKARDLVPEPRFVAGARATHIVTLAPGQFWPAVLVEDGPGARLIVDLRMTGPRGASPLRLRRDRLREAGIPESVLAVVDAIGFARIRVDEFPAEKVS